MRIVEFGAQACVMPAIVDRAVGRHTVRHFKSAASDPAQALLQLVEESVHAASHPSGVVYFEASNLPLRGCRVQQKSRHKSSRKSRSAWAMQRAEVSWG